MQGLGKQKEGITTQLSAALARSLEWTQWRTQALCLSPVCEICGSRRRLQVHHLDSTSYLVEKYKITKENWRQFSDVLFDPDNVAVLCYNHHNKSNGFSFHAVFGRKNTTRDQFILYLAECYHILERW